jgi:type I restriction enzyme, S subunit
VSDFELPKGWLLTSLGEIADWGSGGTPSRKTESYYGGTIPWVKTGDLGPKILTQASEFITEHAVANSSAKFFPKGSVAIAMYGATIGKTSILGIDATTNQACGVGNPIKGVTFTEFLYYMLCNEKDNFIAKGKGGAQPNISQALIKEHEIALPPLPEQQQIAQKLDELLAQVGTLKTRLDAIPNILKRFRQSVLAAAVSGRLTEEWRGNCEYIPTELNFDIPASWSLQTIDDIANVKGGKRLPKGDELLEVDTGYKYIRAGQLKNGTIVSGSDARNRQLYIAQNVYEQIKRYTISEGDAYLTIVGASIGDAGIAPKEFHGANLTENAAKLCEYKQPVCSAYIGYWLRSQHIQDLIQLEIKSGAQGKLALMRIKTLPFPKISIEEQTEIVRRVEQLFTYADQVEQRVIDAQARVNHLTQSILAKAFRGELTAEWRVQNPALISGENSAVALLERVKMMRSLKKTTKKNGVVNASFIYQS